VNLSTKRSLARGGRQARSSDKSHLDGVREERVTPLVHGPHEVRLGVDCSTFAIAPFSSVGIEERKVSHLVFAGLFPMVDRQRLTMLLAIETGPHPFYAAGSRPWCFTKVTSNRFRHNIRLSRRFGPKKA
jgi:hypothetical protein